METLTRKTTAREPRKLLASQIEQIKEEALFRVQGLETAFELCQSPLEQVFFLEYVSLYGAEPAWLPGDFACFAHAISQPRDGIKEGWVFIELQRQIELPNRKVRVDFLITVRAYVGQEHRTLGQIVVEVDGHDFHERTKEQATRDRSRDRLLTAAGYKVLRFTGSEIYKDPLNALFELSSFIDEVAHV